MKDCSFHALYHEIVATYVSHICIHGRFSECTLQDKCPHERTYNARYAVLHPIMIQGIE